MNPNGTLLDDAGTTTRLTPDELKALGLDDAACLAS